MSEFAAKIKSIENAIPPKMATGLLLTVGVIFILVALFAQSNILKLALVAYAIVP